MIKRWARVNLYKSKKPFNIYDIDVDKILISKKEPLSKKNPFKYFLGYNDDEVIRPLCIKLPQMIGHFDSFKVQSTRLFKVQSTRLKYEEKLTF